MTKSGRPTPPIALGAPPERVTGRLATRRVEIDAALLGRLRSACPDITTEDGVVAESSRDWWPLAMIWALDGQVAARAAAVARPGTPDEITDLLRICNEARVPVTAAAGRSGVCGASVPAHGGLVLDLCGLSGIVDVDRDSLILDVLAGTFGTWLESTLRADHGVTAGHWPQSIDLSTVGGWLACRGAGQLSTRYGKIEDIVLGLDVALADGTRITTGGCLYFTFAGQVDADRRDAYYRELWDAGQSAVLDNGGALSHHHGVGLNRSRFVHDALGPAFEVLVATKQALDPNGILNPGKLGLPDPWAGPDAVWPDQVH